MKYIFIAFFTCVFCLSGISQTAIPPLDIPLYLAGNFGELRTNHFHAGIDFKTQGKTGFPVKSVRNGYVSRILVSSYGYGRALYVDHPDGTTTVYGHLDHFSKEIEAFTVDSQYIKETFSVDMLIEPGKFPVKKGQVIAFSGNTGGSAGPHLHFELRETATQNMHDPLVLFTNQIQDSLKPQLLSLMVYPQRGAGVVNGSPEKQLISIKKDKQGDPFIAPEIKAWGKVGFGIKTFDYMNETRNTYGVKEICLSINDTTVFHSYMSTFAFSETRYLNSFIDWEEWTYKKSFYIKSFIEPGNHLSIYRLKEDGIYNFNEEKTYRLEYTLKDQYGNTATFSFAVKGEKQIVPTWEPSGILFSYNRDNAFEKDGVSLQIPEGNLYTDLWFSYAATPAYTRFSPLYKLHERTPLHLYCPLTVTIQKDLFPQKEKYGIISYESGKKNWIGGVYEAGKLTAKIRELGNFSVDVDTVAPIIKVLNRTSWSKTRTVSFKVTDNLSGINSWYATLDGKFILFELDAKRALLFCTYDPERMKPGSGKLKLSVKDGCENECIFEEIINW